MKKIKTELLLFLLAVAFIFNTSLIAKNTAKAVVFCNFDDIKDESVAYDSIIANNRKGRLIGNAKSSKGKFKTALEFDGKNSAVDFGKYKSVFGFDEFTTIKTGSIEFFFSPGKDIRANAKMSVIVECCQAPRFFINKQGELVVLWLMKKWAGKNIHVLKSGISSWNANTWYHVKFTWDKNGHNLFIDNKLVASDKLNGGVLAGFLNVTLGAYWNGKKFSNYFAGEIDELKVTFPQIKARLYSDPKFNIINPLQSKGLNPVKVIDVKGLSALKIASKTKALVPIVCPKIEYYRKVATQLKKYLDLATDADFLIIDKAPQHGRAIFVGPNSLENVKAIFDKAQSMPSESFVIESVAEGLVIVGKDDFCKNRLHQKKRLYINDRHQSRGTFFGTVDFLERFVGIRYYFPGIGTFIPNYSTGDLVLPPVKYSDTPVFNYRAHGYNWGTDFAAIKSSRKEATFWNNLLRLGDTELATSWHTDDRWHMIFAKTHPEYFALRSDGTRAIGDRGSFSSFRCYTSEEGFRAHINAIDNYYKTGKGRELFSPDNRDFAPNKKYIHWGVADGFRGCKCTECMKLVDTVTAGGTYSKLYYNYVLKLAKEIKKRWPDKILKIHAYGPYRRIPAFVDKENPGNILFSAVRVGVDSTSAAFLKEDSLYKVASSDARRRRKLSPDKPYIWLHYPHVPRAHNSIPMPYLAPHFYQKFFAENKKNISGVFFNGFKTYSCVFDSLILYIMYKVSWNPDFNVDACVAEYCKTMFGPAAKEAKEFYDILIKQWENIKFGKTTKCSDVVVKKDFYFKNTYPKNIRKKLEILLRKAFFATKPGTIYRERVVFLKNGFKPFFEFGRYVDLGKVFKMQCFNFTPSKIDGLIGGADGYHAQGVQCTYLYKNDTGKFDQSTIAQIYTSHDKENLYIAGMIKQPEAFKTLSKTKSLRDSNIWSRSSLEIFLCPEMPGLKEAGIGQKTQFYQIAIDPKGSIWDAYNGDASVNLNLKLKVFRNLRNKMYFELVIPFKELKCIVPKNNSQWYVNFYWNRNLQGDNKHYAWAGTGGYKDTSRFGTLIFKDAVPVKRIKKKK